MNKEKPQSIEERLGGLSVICEQADKYCEEKGYKTTPSLVLLKETIEQLTQQAKREVVEEVVKNIKCINPNCDEKGTIAVQGSDGDWEPEQCQYCYEVRFPLIEKIKSLLITDKEHG